MRGFGEPYRYNSQEDAESVVFNLRKPENTNRKWHYQAVNHGSHWRVWVTTERGSHYYGEFPL